MTQTDIGRDFEKGLWYLEGRTDNRVTLGAQLVDNGNINLENVMVDSISWGPVKGDSIDKSHGRMRIYDGNECTMERTYAIADRFDIKGASDGFFFKQLQKHEDDLIIKFNLKSMDWTLTIGNESLITKNYAGNISGTINDEDFTFIVTKPKSVLYSQMITLINSPLRVK
jgi:hypothetical protein